MTNLSQKQLYSAIGKNNIYAYLKDLNYRRKKEILYYRRLKELQNIVKHNDLQTFYQPIVKMETGETIGYEALNRPQCSNIFANTESFYDFVGQSNQVFLFECFCRNLSLKRFMERSKGNTQLQNSLLFINIHPNVLLDQKYHSGETLHLLSKLGLEPNQIIFELTEKSAVTDYTLFEKVLSNYRSQGFRIAIDDVGSGYNSLKTLVYLKPEFIKLDRALIQHIDQNLEQQQLVSLIIDYAKQSFTKIIAEGIERTEEFEYLRNRGVHFGQGYAIGKPYEELIPGSIPCDSIKIANMSS